MVKRELTQEQAIQLEEKEPSLARIIPIRTETALSRRPIHKLSKKGTIKIKEVRKNERGQAVTMWEVRNPPGPLAYKVDKLIIDRRIYESRPNVPELLKIGSESEICRELELADSGKNRANIKEAFFQNAGALIISSIEYTGNDGTMRDFTFSSSRYAVYFIGETLPNGKRADAVYVRFHEDYYKLLKHSGTRPLDYEYLKSLPPAAQRVYELISFAIFGAIKHERDCAIYLYSQLCSAAPLTRYYEWDKAKKQLYKLHRPHIQSGYLKAVSFEETKDSEGRADWLIRYTPGRKAKNEFKEFTTKKEKSISAAALRPKLVEVKSEDRKENAPARTPEDAALIETLTDFGVGESRAARLIEKDRAECEIWAAAWPHQNQKGMENPAAVLISFIEKRHRPLPAAYKKAQQIAERKKEHEERERQQKAAELHYDYFAPLYHIRLRTEFLELEQTRPEEVKEFKAHFEKKHAKALRMVTSEERRERITLQKAAEFFNELRPDLGVILTTFEEWNENENQENAEPLDWFNRDLHGILKELEQRASK